MSHCGSNGPGDPRSQDPHAALTLEHLVAQQSFENHDAPPGAGAKPVALEQGGRRARLVEDSGLLVDARVGRYFRHLAEGAVEAGAELLVASRLSRDPGTQLERWMMPHMQGVPAREGGYPVACFILMKADRRARTHSEGIARGAPDERLPSD